MQNSFREEGGEEIALLGSGGPGGSVELLPASSITPLSSAQQMKEKMKVIFNNNC